jgi:tripartite-type tricarboxylate transporter receptor subunit TctC
MNGGGFVHTARHSRGAATTAMAVMLFLATAFGAVACGDSGGEGGGGGGSGDAEFKRPITLIVPFGPGSGTDQAARLVAPVLEKGLGVQLPVINVPGATGNTGMTKLLQSRPSETIAALPADTIATVAAGTATFQLDDLKPICRISLAPSFIWVNTKGKYKSWDELSKAAKDQPGKVTIATVGQGGIDDIMLGALEQKGFKFRLVPFAENSERKGALLSNDVDALYEQSGDVKENIDGGQFTPVLMFASEKQQGLKGDYTLSSEIGVTDVIEQNRGLFASAKMPDNEVDAIAKACAAVKADPKYTEFQERTLEKEGGFLPAAEYGTYTKELLANMQKLGKQYGVYK